MSFVVRARPRFLVSRAPLMVWALAWLPSFASASIDRSPEEAVADRDSIPDPDPEPLAPSAPTPADREEPCLDARLHDAEVHEHAGNFAAAGDLYASAYQHCLRPSSRVGFL